MFSTTIKFTLKKQIIAAMLILSMMFVFVPQKSDGIFLAILVLTSGAAAVTVGAVIFGVLFDAIVLCAVGVICGGGGGGGGSFNPGDQCQIANSCDIAVVGEISGSGICVDSAGDTLQPPPEELCDAFTFPLDDDSLLIFNSVVRKGDSVEVRWDLNGNSADNCDLTGPQVPSSYDLVSETGQITITNVQSPYVYTLTCGTGSAVGDDITTVTKSVRLVPSFFE